MAVFHDSRVKPQSSLLTDGTLFPTEERFGRRLKGISRYFVFVDAIRGISRVVTLFTGVRADPPEKATATADIN